MQERAEFPGQDGGAEAPKVPADDDGVRPASKGDDPAAPGPVAVVVVLIDLDADLVVVGTPGA